MLQPNDEEGMRSVLAKEGPVRTQPICHLDPYTCVHLIPHIKLNFCLPPDYIPLIYPKNRPAVTWEWCVYILTDCLCLKVTVSIDATPTLMQHYSYGVWDGHACDGTFISNLPLLVGLTVTLVCTGLIPQMGPSWGLCLIYCMGRGCSLADEPRRARCWRRLRLNGDVGVQLHGLGPLGGAGTNAASRDKGSMDHIWIYGSWHNGRE
jgi:hypothetical protein